MKYQSKTESQIFQVLYVVHLSHIFLHTSVLFWNTFQYTMYKNFPYSYNYFHLQWFPENKI